MKFIVHDTLDSTNEEARRLLNEGAISETTIIRARAQTAGRGTQGRAWVSPPGAGLYLSIVHPFEGAVASVPVTPLFTLAAGVACAETLRDLAGLTVQLKPVNDLYIGGCKLGGILCESILASEAHGAVCKALITGIGINVYAHESVQEGCMLDKRANVPTSLQNHIAPAVFGQWRGDAIMEELAVTLSEAVDRRYRQLIVGDAPGIIRAYLQFKLAGVDLPADLARQLPQGSLPVC